MSLTIQEKRKAILELFATCKKNEEKYEILIKLGKSLPLLDKSQFSLQTLVEGCQSVMHLQASVKEGRLYFEAYSDALISSGLAALLVEFYNGQTPEEILTHPPSFLEELGLFGLLTPGRANGLASLYKKIRSLALIKLAEAQARNCS